MTIYLRTYPSAAWLAENKGAQSITVSAETFDKACDSAEELAEHWMISHVEILVDDEVKVLIN
jgi:hypothetical protein